eukprot:scaffold271147_cov18-Prasinocladus_malaysianus.AAC.1
MWSDHGVRAVELETKSSPRAGAMCYGSTIVILRKVLLITGWWFMRLPLRSSDTDLTNLLDCPLPRPCDSA